MGSYRTPINVGDVAHQINSACHTCGDMRTDSYLSWGIKQDLYRLKWILDDALSRCPEFSIEPEWLKEQEKIRIIKYLKNDIQ